MTLADYLATIRSPALAQAITTFAYATEEISEVLRTSDGAKASTINTFGEEQLALDVRSDKIIWEHLEESGLFATGSSEEEAREVPLAGTGFSAAWDPLDGSSLVDANLAIGTIFGIWSGADILGRTGRELAAAGYAVYGPRTLFIIAAAGHQPQEFVLDTHRTQDTALPSVWEHTRELSVVHKKIFAPGNLRAAADNPAYAARIKKWMDEGYTLRYSGGMVPDVHHILAKGGGVFSYPASDTHPAKLRLAYECAPLAFVMEAAGGASSDGSQSILDIPIAALDQRVPIWLGGKEEITA